MKIMRIKYFMPTLSKLMRNEGGSAFSGAAILGLAGAGIGGIIGYVGDAAYKNYPVLYRAQK